MSIRNLPDTCTLSIGSILYKTKKGIVVVYQPQPEKLTVTNYKHVLQ
jgi:hypothetical protein